MLDVILLPILLSLFCCGVFAITEPGKIFYGYRKAVERAAWLGELKKPLATCVVCMSSVWGSLGFVLVWLAAGWAPGLHLIAAWLYSVVACSFLNYLFWQVLCKVEANADYHETMTKIQRHIHSQVL